VRNWGVTGQEVDLDPPYCVRFIYDGEGGDLFGRSRFENCKDWIQLKWDIREKIRTDLNITIGNIMQVGYPVDDNGDQAKTIQNEAKAANIGVSLAKGLCVTYPTFSMKNQIAMARDGVDPPSSTRGRFHAWKPAPTASTGSRRRPTWWTSKSFSAC
jgi:hypothetical protein